MNIVTTSEELQLAKQLFDTPPVLVPTMGALHLGHLTLIRKAREIAGPQGCVAVSIFVNPIQFDNPSDLASYPDTLAEDLSQCDELGVDIVFTPAADALYAPDRSITISEKSLANTLCGATRPGHFDGVCTIVAKLFNLFSPSHAVFGKKDFQQLAIIRRMVRDLDFQICIEGAETVRESDGLAFSSRNVRLSDEDRAQAPIIRKALLSAQQQFANGTTDTSTLLTKVGEEISAIAPTSRIDYLECVDSNNLQSTQTIQSPAVIAIAIFFGKVRLIDNIELVPSI